MSTLPTSRSRRAVLAVVASVILASFAALPVAAFGAPYVSGTSPADGDIDVAADATLSVTFDEPVTVTDGWFSIDCGVSLSHSAVVSGGPETWTINPDQDFAAGESCAFTTDRTAITDADGFHPDSNGFFGFTVAGVAAPSAPPPSTFGAFKWPIKALPAVNRAWAGWAVPIRFTLTGDPGPHSFTAASQQYTCGTTPPSTATLAAVTRGHRAIRYNSRHDTYTFVWKTSRSWKHTCRVFVLTLDDGQTQAIAFRFR